MVNGNEMHYIMSGMTHTKADECNDETMDWYCDTYKSMSNDNYKFGILFNAFQEERLFHVMSDQMKASVCDIHADSGGLQIITRGMKVTPEAKNTIYERQAKYSTIAMSFDEIPVRVLKGSGVFVSKWFDHSIVEKCAIQSGKNLLEQIEYFDKIGTKAKPLLIAQGNDLESFSKWVELLQKQIPQDLRKYIGGVAMAGSSIGMGDLENIRTAFYYTQLPIDFECKQLHLLGVGSFMRFLPTMVMMKTGLYKDLAISFDSTTHTGALSYGNYCDANNKLVKLGRHYNEKNYTYLFNEIQKYNTGIKSPKHLYELYVTFNGITKLREHDKVDEYPALCKMLTGMALMNVSNTMSQIVDYVGSSDTTKHIPPKMKSPIKNLYKVKTLSDFKHWEKNFAGRIGSKHIPTYAPASFGDFFD